MVDDLPLVSVIIVNYKQYALLENCIVSVLRSSYSNIEVIVVDNEFCIEKLELIMKKFPNVRYYPIKENLNYAEGNNYGIEVSKGDYVVLLNNDTEVRTNWLEPLMEQAQKDPRAFYQPKILLLDNKDTIFSTGCTVHPTGVAYPIGLGKRIGPDDRFENIKQVFYCVGACILASKSTIREVGSLDSNYWTYYEDVNLGWKRAFDEFSFICHSRIDNISQMGRKLWAGVIIQEGIPTRKRKVIYHFKELFVPNSCTLFSMAISLGDFSVRIYVK